MKKIKYLKPTGVELIVNDTEANRHYADCAGWKEVKPPKKKAVVKKEVQLLDKQL